MIFGFFHRKHRVLVQGAVVCGLLAQAGAQNLIDVKFAGGTPGAPSGAAVVGTTGDFWNYFPGLNGRAAGGGVVTNATAIKDSSGATLSGATLTLSLSAGAGVASYTDNNSFSPAPSLIMGNYVYESNGANYWTINFSGLPPSKPYMVCGLGNGNATGQGTTWWVDVANGHATASATANYSNGSRDATLAGNQGICWVKVPATTTAAGGLTFRVVDLNGSESGTGGSGRAYMNGFQLQPLSAPVISGLANLTVMAGTTATLSPAISGIPTPSCQWRSNNVVIAGATGPSLTFNNIQFSQNGVIYSLVASNLVGRVTNSMTMTVTVTPSISGLVNQAVAVGTTVTNAPTVAGVPAPWTHWRLEGNDLADGATGNGSTIAGSATSLLIINNAQAADTGTYSLVASNSAGVVTNSMTLTVSTGDVPPAITGPTDQTVVQSSNATFSASVSGLPLPALQWQVNGAAISGQTNSSLVVTNVQYSQNGYVYSLVAGNRTGMATNSAMLYVLVPPNITQSPTNLTVVAGSPAIFHVTAIGVPSVQYQWNRNGSPIPNATSAAYTIDSTLGADNGAVFSVTVSNRLGTATSSNAKLTVLSTMTATFLPTNGAVNISPDQQLRLVFSGNSPILNTNGVITIRDAANNSVVAAIDSSQFLSYTPGNTSIQTIPNAAIRAVEGESFYYMPIALYGNEAWVTFTNRLAYGHTYYVTCDTGLFLDTNGAAFPGVTGTNTWSFSTKPAGPVTPTTSTGPTTITVGQDGIGDFATFQGAFDWIPQNNTLARTIRVKQGIYRDSASLAQNRNFVTIVGAGASRTNTQLVYPFAYFAPPNTVFTAGSLRIESSDVTVLNLALDNLIYNVYHPTGNPSSGAAGAFAGAINTLATTGKRIVFDNVLIKGGQDTIYNISGIVYYNNCEVWGSVDFIYGAALGVFDQCNIVEIRSTGGPCTAPNTAYAQPYGMTFLNCTFPQALVANGYPYNVGAATTTYMRPWGKDGMTAAINCALGSQFSTAGYQTFGNTNEDECRAREYGTTLIGGGSALTSAQRQAAGAYWANTIDPDYTSNPSLIPTDSLLAPPTGTNNRVAVTINPGDYTLAAIFGNSYFNLNGWLPTVMPAITLQPADQSTIGGQPVSFAVSATGLPNPAYQWTLNNTNIQGATNATLIIPIVNLTNAGTYSVIVSNSTGLVISSNAVLSVADTAPGFAPIPDQTLNAGATLTVTNVVTDFDAPPQTLTFGLLTNPLNSTLSVAGVFNWRPPVSQAGTTNPVSVIVTDNGTPNLSATNNFNVIVNAVSKPSLGAISYHGTQLSFTVNGGTVGPDYLVEISTNLTDWQTLLTTNSPPQPFTFTDTNISAGPAKFYRTKLIP